MFLKFSNTIINPRYIHFINIADGKYTIHMVSHFVNGAYFFGSGAMETKTITMNICRKENPDDYNLMTKWIQKITPKW